MLEQHEVVYSLGLQLNQGYEDFCRKTAEISWNIAGDGGVPQNFAVTILKHQIHDM